MLAHDPRNVRVKDYQCVQVDDTSLSAQTLNRMDLWHFVIKCNIGPQLNPIWSLSTQTKMIQI